MPVNKKLIAKQLPNFPNEILEEWLFKCVERQGWPPKGLIWDNVLLNRNFDFWTQVSWEKTYVDLGGVAWMQSSNEIIGDLESAYLLGGFNAYAVELGKNGMNRFMSAMKYILEHGTFPKPIAVLRDSNEYGIADGHHRVVAWKSAIKIVDILKRMEISPEHRGHASSFRQSLKSKWGVEQIADISLTQEVWLAKLP